MIATSKREFRCGLVNRMKHWLLYVQLWTTRRRRRIADGGETGRGQGDPRSSQSGTSIAVDKHEWTDIDRLSCGRILHKLTLVYISSVIILYYIILTHTHIHYIRTRLININIFYVIGLHQLMNCYRVYENCSRQ